MSMGCVAQSITYLTADTCLTADSGGRELIQARSHTFVEINHEIISTAIILPFRGFKKSCSQLHAKVCAKVLVNCLVKLAQDKMRLGELTIPT